MQSARTESISKLAKTNAKTIAGIIGAAIILIMLAISGRQYISECRAAGKDVDQCWDKGLAIAGMGAGGPLSAGVVLGYIVGTAGKEKEKADKYKEGYWTLNPDLRDDNQP
jgi:hypothetical protein